MYGSYELSCLRFYLSNSLGLSSVFPGYSRLPSQEKEEHQVLSQKGGI